MTHERQGADVQAWTIAQLMRRKDLPDLQVFMDQVWGARDADPDALQMKLEQLARAWGAQEVA